MYCPHCGQQQISSDVRYCSRCGFPLAVTTQLLANGGVLPNLTADEKLQSPKRRAIKQGALLIMIAALLVPLFAALGAPEELVGSLAIIGFGGGLLRIIYAMMFLSALPQTKKTNQIPSVRLAESLNLNAAQSSHALPPQSTRVSLFNNARRDTGELVPPPSVTDRTTRLLEKRESE